MSMTLSQINELEKLIPSMDEKDKRRTAELIKKWYTDSTQQVGRDNFLTFVDHVYPGVSGRPSSPPPCQNI